MLSFDIRKHEVSKVSTSLNILGLWLLTSLKICQSSYYLVSTYMTALVIATFQLNDAPQRWLFYNKTHVVITWPNDGLRDGT